MFAKRMKNIQGGTTIWKYKKTYLKIINGIVRQIKLTLIMKP